jgi:hypothetical protein
VIRPAIGIERDMVAATVIRAMDQHIAGAGCAHFAEGDFGGVVMFVCPKAYLSRLLAWVIHRRRRAYLIFSYAAAKSASGIGIVMVSLARFWNETFSCLPDLMAASMSGATGMLA